MAQIDALIVIYNKPLAESQTVLTLNAPDDVQVWVADNSTEDYDNRAFAEAHGCRYVDMGGNMGLSKAYNRVISMLDKSDGLICLFDDDTMVDSRYFQVLKEAERIHPEINLFAPVVKDGKGILSPCLINGVFCKRIKSVNKLPKKGISVVNSGLAVRLKVFQDYQYDEGLFLDYIDHAFVRDIAGHNGTQIHIMDELELGQEFSGSEKRNKKVAINRYKIFQKDITHFCIKYGISLWEKNALLLKRWLRLTLN